MEAPSAPSRAVYCADALEWLDQAAPNDDWAYVTSLPDVSELGGAGLDDWKRWFVEAARRVLAATSTNGVAIFYQTDIKKAGVWIDKSYLCQKAAEALGVPLLWHKIVCRKSPGTVTFGRPAYAHVLCFSRGLTSLPPPHLPDVLPEMGATLWARGMGAETCRALVRFVRTWTRCRTIVDPFCGKGSMLAAANAQGLAAIGVELSAKRARQARTLQWPEARDRSSPTDED